MVVVRSLLDCRVGMGHGGLRVLLEAAGNNCFLGRSESRWGEQ
jgi:hypothetical protein